MVNVHKLQQALSFAQSIIDTVREPILILDAQLHVRSASRAFYATFGVTPQETKGRFIYDLGNGQWNIAALRKLLESILPTTRTVVDYEVVHDFPTLGPRVMLVNARQLWTEHHDVPLVFVAIEDITDRKRIFDELVSSSEDIQRFAYTAAHDLRTPLSAALNLSQLLARRVEGKLDPEEQYMLRTSIESMERLNVLMNDILTLSGLGSAPQQRKWIPLSAPVELALSNLQHHIQQNAATITVGELPEVLTNQTQMVMVFQNLIGNALKYRRAEPPRICIGAQLEGSEWRVFVTDNGQGFKPEHAAIIFEPFKRLHGYDTKGSGIGLATCKRIVERAGGRIWAESTPDHGSTFSFTLPAEQTCGSE